MAKATITTNIHQSFDVHGCFTTQVTFDGKKSNLIPDFFQISVSKVLYLLGEINCTGFANLASARATNSKNCSETNLSMLLRGNINTSDTSNFRPLNLLKSALALLVTWISTDHTNNTLAADYFTVAANFLNGSRNSHYFLLNLFN